MKKETEEKIVKVKGIRKKKRIGKKVNIKIDKQKKRERTTQK